MEITTQQLEETLGKVIDNKINGLVTHGEFVQLQGEFTQLREDVRVGFDSVDTKLDIIVGELADLKQEYIFIKDWIIKHEEREKKLEAVIDDLKRRVAELEKQAA